MKIAIIAAVANNHVIGADNKLLWHLPADLKHFKNLTIGHTMIMGRKTFESIGKPLPGRRTIVVTRKENYDAKGCDVVHSLNEAFELAKENEEIFVVGGAEIYQQTIDLTQTQKLYITRVFALFEGDAFFPNVDPRKWKLTERADHQANEKNPFNFTFLTYERRV
jgi:dihydrofolate reductase